jgi:hypothetical protein
MPALQVALGPLNERFNAGHVGNREINPPEVFAEGCQLSDLVESEEYIPKRAAVAFLEQMPPALHEAIRAVIREDLLRETPLPITFAWQPGYDWELTVNDVASTDETHGGITVIVRSRYPDDEHPLDRKGA